MNNKWDMYLEALQGHAGCVARTLGVGVGNRELLSSFLPPSEYNKVLAIGCADGMEVKDLMEYGYDAMGLTIGAENVEYAKKELGVMSVLGDLHDMPFSCDYFDAIYMNHSMEHFFSPFIGMLEINSVLKLRGRVLTTAPLFVNGDNPHTTISFHHPGLLTLDIYKSLFKATGFSIIHDNSGETEMRCVLEKTNKDIHGSIVLALHNRKSLSGNNPLTFIRG